MELKTNGKLETESFTFKRGARHIFNKIYFHGSDIFRSSSERKKPQFGWLVSDVCMSLEDTQNWSHRSHDWINIGSGVCMWVFVGDDNYGLMETILDVVVSMTEFS